MLLSDAKESQGSVRHSHTGEPAELQLPEAPAREAKTTEKTKADAGQDEELVKVLVEKILLRGLEQVGWSKTLILFWIRPGLTLSLGFSLMELVVEQDLD